MRAFTVYTEDGKEHVVVADNIKDVEHVPGKAGVRPEPAKPAVEGHPGEPDRPGAGPGEPARAAVAGKAPIAAQPAKKAVEGVDPVPDTCVIHLKSGGSHKVQMTAKQIVELLNKPY
jgi:hypothetical protein